jgi:predicted SAM-dependent methyltransferase
MEEAAMKKLHLGCGQKYLGGYVNIDFPLSEHSVQNKSIADEFYDITKLTYPSNSIQEVRLHHIFEHFGRPIACALIASWNSWLTEKGILHIEVPDFEKTAKIAISKFRHRDKKKVAIHHLFGSHEAKWAIHAEGYSEWMIEDIMLSFGFKKIKTLKNDWHGTYNLEIVAEKENDISFNESFDRAEMYLRDFLVDDTEQELLNVWLEQFKNQIEKTWAK